VGKAKSYRQRLIEQERFLRGCREALDACDNGPKTDAEHNELARRLGRPDLVRELQNELPMGPTVA
jgi:hypothetical protein